MPPEVQRFVLITGLVAGAMLAGYLARRVLKVRESVAHKAMWFVVVVGYPSVGLLSVWQIHLAAEHAWLPVLAAVYITSLTFIALGLGKLLTRDRSLGGLFGLAGGLGNTGFTMGAFLCYQFFGKQGLGLAAVHDLAWSLMTVCLMYPLARHYSAEQPLKAGLRRLLWLSVWDIRSLSLAATIVGIVLNVAAVPVPAVLPRIRFTEAMMFTAASLAFFSVGLRLHMSQVRPLWKLIVGLGVVRFVIGPALGAALAALTYLTAFPLTGVARQVFAVETCIPTAVTMVAIANLFNVRPREASVLFVFNTAMYLALCVPILAWLFG